MIIQTQATKLRLIEENVRAWAKTFCVPYGDPLEVRENLVIFARTKESDAAVAELVVCNRLLPWPKALTQNHHYHGEQPSASWRENEVKFAVQIIRYDKSEVDEVDVDEYNAHPSQGVGVTVAHGIEVLWHRIRGIQGADHAKVQRVFRKRGYVYA